MAQAGGPGTVLPGQTDPVVAGGVVVPDQGALLLRQIVGGVGGAQHLGHVPAEQQVYAGDGLPVELAVQTADVQAQAQGGGGLPIAGVIETAAILIQMQDRALIDHVADVPVAHGWAERDVVQKVPAAAGGVVLPQPA